MTERGFQCANSQRDSDKKPGLKKRHVSCTMPYNVFCVENWKYSLLPIHTKIDNYNTYFDNPVKAEWMYSQSKGRQFTPGEQKQLIQYLGTVVHAVS